MKRSGLAQSWERHHVAAAKARHEQKAKKSGKSGAVVPMGDEPQEDAELHRVMQAAKKNAALIEIPNNIKQLRFTGRTQRF
jgi:hypothetical protein